MHKTRFFYTFSIVLFCFIYKPIHGQEKIYFEPKSAIAGTQSTFIEYVDAIPLETKPESRFDKYSSLTTTKKYYVILDYSSKKVLIFNKEGRFIKNIPIKLDISQFRYNDMEDRMELVTLNKNYTLSAKDNAQIIEHYDEPRNKKYFRKYFIDLKDSLHFSLHKEKITSLDILDPVSLTMDMRAINKVTVDKNFEKDTDYELKIFKNNRLLNQYFPYDKKKDPRYIFDRVYINVSPSLQPHTWWVTHPYDYTIYKLTTDSLYKVYSVILPMERAMPQDFFTKDFPNKNEKDNYKRQNRKVIKQLFMGDLSQRYLYFSYNGLMFDFQQYIYDVKTKSIYDNEKIAPDSLTWYLPILKSRSSGASNISVSKILAEDALESFTANKAKNIVYPSKLQNYFATARSTDNPILILYRYKN